MSTESRKSWFIREVSLGNLLIAIPLVGGLFVGYGKWTTMENKILEHSEAIKDLTKELQAFDERYSDSQAELKSAITKLTVEVDERTAKGGK